MVQPNDMDKIIKKLRENLHILRRDFRVSKIGVFGSVARGEETNQSDIDIIVEFAEPIGLFRFMALENFLSLLLEKKVDLVTKNALKPVIKEKILKESVYV